MTTRIVSVLLFEDVEVLDFAGPFEVFNVANDDTSVGIPSAEVYERFYPGVEQRRVLGVYVARRKAHDSVQLLFGADQHMQQRLLRQRFQRKSRRFIRRGAQFSPPRPHIRQALHRITTHRIERALSDKRPPIGIQIQMLQRIGRTAQFGHAFAQFFRCGRPGAALRDDLPLGNSRMLVRIPQRQ